VDGPSSTPSVGEDPIQTNRCLKNDDTGDREQNYARNYWSMRRAPIDDPALEFSRAAPTTDATTEIAV